MKKKVSVRKEMDAWRTEKERIIETLWRNIIWKTSIHGSKKRCSQERKCG